MQTERNPTSDQQKRQEGGHICTEAGNVDWDRAWGGASEETGEGPS